MPYDYSASVDERRLNFEIEKHARERWWHEDNLVNQRTTWLLTTQGVLGTAFGFVKYRIAELSFRAIDKPVEFKLPDYVETLRVFADCLTAIGLVSALAAWAGIYAAHRAQRALQASHGPYLGVTEHTTRLGYAVGLSTPMLCIVAWLVALSLFR